MPSPNFANDDFLKVISDFTEMEAFLFDSLHLAQILILNNKTSTQFRAENFDGAIGITGNISFDSENERVNQPIKFRNFHGKNDSVGQICGSWNKNTGLHWKCTAIFNRYAPSIRTGQSGQFLTVCMCEQGFFTTFFPRLVSITSRVCTL